MPNVTVSTTFANQIAAQYRGQPKADRIKAIRRELRLWGMNRVLAAYEAIDRLLAVDAPGVLGRALPAVEPTPDPVAIRNVQDDAGSLLDAERFVLV